MLPACEAGLPFTVTRSRRGASPRTWIFKPPSDSWPSLRFMTAPWNGSWILNGSEGPASAGLPVASTAPAAPADMILRNFLRSVFMSIVESSAHSIFFRRRRLESGAAIAG